MQTVVTRTVGKLNLDLFTKEAINSIRRLIEKGKPEEAVKSLDHKTLYVQKRLDKDSAKAFRQDVFMAVTKGIGW